MKKSQIDKEIENELEKVSERNSKTQERSVEKINLISKNLASKIIEDITGENLTKVVSKLLLKKCLKIN